MTALYVWMHRMLTVMLPFKAILHATFTVIHLSTATVENYLIMKLN